MHAFTAVCIYLVRTPDMMHGGTQTTQKDVAGAEAARIYFIDQNQNANEFVSAYRTCQIPSVFGAETLEKTECATCVLLVCSQRGVKSKVRSISIILVGGTVAADNRGHKVNSEGLSIHL